MSFYETTPLGRIVNRFSKDIDVIDTLLPRNVYSFLQTFVSILGTLFLICYSTPFFLTVLVPLCLLYIFIQVRESGRCIKVARYSFYNALKVNWWFRNFFWLLNLAVLSILGINKIKIKCFLVMLLETTYNMEMTNNCYFFIQFYSCLSLVDLFFRNGRPKQFSFFFSCSCRILSHWLSQTLLFNRGYTWLLHDSYNVWNPLVDLRSTLISLKQSMVWAQSELLMHREDLFLWMITT